MQKQAEANEERKHTMKLTSKILILAALIILTVLPSYAETGKSLDMTEAIELTLKNNSELRSIREEALKADAFKLQADGTLLPSITLYGSIDEQKENQTTDGSSRYDSREAGATLEQIIYSGGKNSAMRRQSGELRTIAAMKIADKENRTIGELFARFYNVLLQKERIKAEESAVKTSKLHKRQTEKMCELGLANRLEFIRAGQQLESDTAKLTEANGLYEAAVISLMNYMAIPPERRREVIGALEAPKAEGTRSASLELANNNRPDLKQLEEECNYQKNQIEIENSSIRPKIALGLSAGYLSPYLKSDTNGDTWRAELSVNIPVFDRNVARSGVIKEEAVLSQNMIALEQKKLDIKSEVETSWTEIETTLHRLEASSAALELAEESLRLAEVGYREGVTPQLDLLTAQSSLTSARLDYLSSKYDHLMTIVALKVTEGTIIKWAGERNSK